MAVCPPPCPHCSQPGALSRRHISTAMPVQSLLWVEPGRQQVPLRFLNNAGATAYRACEPERLEGPRHGSKVFYTE